MHFIPFLRIRGSPEAEIVGLDEHEIGEFAYEYVGLEQEIHHGIEAHGTSGGREPEHHPHTHGKQTPDSNEKQT
jgi:Amt family ammonium transporter